MVFAINASKYTKHQADYSLQPHEDKESSVLFYFLVFEYVSGEHERVEKQAVPP